MITIQRILCPTDLTSESDEALRYAVALASAYKAKLFLLYCTKNASDGNGEKGKPSDIEMDALFTGSLAPHLGLNAFCDLDWQGSVCDDADNVGKAIVEEAEKQKIDFIVMRSRRRPHAAILLGSTAEHVCRNAPCPVLVTHAREREWVGLSTGEIDLKRILSAHDFSSDSELALNYALSLAQEYQTELHLLHVLTGVENEEYERAWVQQTESPYTGAAGKLQRAIPKETFLWCRVTNVVRRGRADQEILAYAKEHEIDLICLGASGSDFSMGALFGSNVDRVLRRSPCPVLIARPVKPTESAATLKPPIADRNSVCT
jgi:nucleotide-binding universal stress UspA family protein